MERESFENERVAKIMNAHFINIKVDREERPDVDKIYMDAAQMINGSGGWPLNCFLTPEGKPFYAGTYFPPEQKYNRPSWLQILAYIKDIFDNQRDKVEKQGDRLLKSIKNNNSRFIKPLTDELGLNIPFDETLTHTIFKALEKRFDLDSGGFGTAPKFPGTMGLQYSLYYHYHTKNELAKNHVLFSIDKMIMGGIYDQIGGGFARYATDKDWLIPHFEKMLYDNALLVSLMADAYKLTKDQLYKEAIEETLEFIAREMTAPNGSFYSALDADSEGVEGKFYVWTKSEIDNILGNDSELFCQFYGISAGGNWEGNNILWRAKRRADFAKENNLDLLKLESLLNQSKELLLTHRAKRIRPGLDDKVLLDWNALQCAAYADAYMALGNETYKTIAKRNLEILLNSFKKTDSIELFHTLKYEDGKETCQYDAFLDDYAFLIRAILKVYEITFDKKLLELAEAYTDLVIQKFYDKNDGLFFFTSESQKDIIIRSKDFYDSATPSGNSIMAMNFQTLAKILDKESYYKILVRMLLQLKDTIKKYPSSFGNWAIALLQEVYPSIEVAVLGSESLRIASKINQQFIPSKIIMASEKEDDKYPLLLAKSVGEETLIYMCRNYACQKPVETIEEFVELL